MNNKEYEWLGIYLESYFHVFQNPELLNKLKQEKERDLPSCQGAKLYLSHASAAYDLNMWSKIAPSSTEQGRREGRWQQVWKLLPSDTTLMSVATA